jgi:hypothetical protein
MKKVFLLIAFAAMALTVVPQAQAQDFAAMQRELQQVQQDLAAGKITEAQAAVRMNEINQRYLGGAGIIGGTPQGSTSGSDAGQAQNWALRDQAMQQSQQAQQMQQQPQQPQFPTGTTNGWPTAAILNRHSLPGLRQPAGTTVSYTVGTGDEVHKLTIYFQGGTQATIDDLARQVQAVPGSARSGYADAGYYSHGLPKPSGLTERGVGYSVVIELQDGGVILKTQPST